MLFILLEELLMLIPAPIWFMVGMLVFIVVGAILIA